MRAASATILALFTILSAILPASPQGEGVRVYVYDPEGKPRGGIELTLTNGTFTRYFTTTTEGFAEFRLLSPGRYNVSAIIEGITVAQATLDYPGQTRLNLTLGVGRLDVLVLDLDGRPAAGITVEVRTENRVISRRGTTNTDGLFTAVDLPYSRHRGVGPYILLGSLGGVTVFNSTLNLEEGVKVLRLSAGVLRVSFNILDISGNPVDAKVRVSSEKGNYSQVLEAGKTAQLPSSRIVGGYVLEVSKQYLSGSDEKVLLREALVLERSQNLTYVLDVGDLVLSVRDDGGAPIQSIIVRIKSERLGVLGQSPTSPSGEVTFKSIPFSEGRAPAGPLIVEVVKDGFIIGSSVVAFTPGAGKLDVTVKRVEVAFMLVAPTGRPVPNATVSLIDTVSRRIYSAQSDEGGRAVLTILPGPHSYDVTLQGVSLARGLINATGGDVPIVVSGVDIELRLLVRDWSGREVEGAGVSVYWRGEPLEVVKLTDGYFRAIIPVAGQVMVDVYLGGAIVERRLLWVSKPTVYEISLRGVAMGGGIIDVESLATVAVGALLAASLASSLLAWRRNVKGLRPRPA